jgi:serpin B
MRALAMALVVIVAACSPAAQSTAERTNTPSQTAGSATQPPFADIAGITDVHSSAGRLPLNAATQAQLDQVVAADTDFALRLYHQIVASDQSDVFLSPYSISTALSMVYAGARGDTAAQMADVLGIGADATAWHAARNRLDLSIADTSDVRPSEGDAVPLTLEPTNTMFGQGGYPFKNDFLDTLAENYGAGMQALDIASDPEAARIAINKWVADRTRDRIEELLKRGVIDEYTVAVLVNAIYFKANWLYQFDPGQTSPEPFHLLDGSTRDVPTMHLAGPKMDFASGDGWSAIRLRYWGASMFVIVPDEGAFADVESRLDTFFLSALGTDMSERATTLSLPRWDTDFQLDLVDALKSLGMADVFDEHKADLTGIADVDQLWISHVVHQANVTVDEKGTEAAAATAAVVERESAARPVNLTVDRPFIYLIQDDASGEILFLGRVLEP